MKWTLTYTVAARDELATIWIDSPERQVVSDAANFIDNQLRSDPLNTGESREVNQRVVIMLPIAMYFYVIPDDMKVIVFHVQEWN
ncbi:MAG: hypothetical protein SH868_14815 [Bythopirellula sp.]|nr:hypothetical protein [Bythopirellula sp.]